MAVLFPVLLSVALLSGLFAVLAVGLLVAERFLINYGTCQIDINGGERAMVVKGGETLLSTLYDEEIFIPSACGGKGTCGYCKLNVVSGGGHVLPTETPYLTRKEMRAGVRLACQVKVRQDIELRIPQEYLNVRLFSATVASTRSLTHDIKEIRLSLVEPEEIDQHPGQYAQIQAPSAEGPVFRAYSISSPSSDKNVVELVVRLVPNGIASTYLHGLQAGDSVAFTGPYGEFRLNEDPLVELVCVGGGCGMAPIKNLIYSACERWPNRKTWMFFGCRTTKDVFYLEEYTKLAQQHPNLKIVYALSDSLGHDEVWDGEKGFIHLSVDKYLEPGVRRQAFLCGPPLMIEAVQHVLREKGMSPEDIYYDEF